MASKIRCLLGFLLILSATAVDVSAQTGGGPEWDPAARGFGRSPDGSSSEKRGAQLEALNRILSTTQLSPVDRTLYLSIRAFQFSRAGRAADSQKDVAEMARVMPSIWQIVLSTTQPELAGGGDRAFTVPHGGILGRGA